MTDVTINLTAVLVAAVSSMVVGFLWYSQLLFGKKWMELVGMTKGHMEEAKAGMGKTYGLSFLGGLVMAYVLAHIVSLTNSVTWLAGATAGFWMWLGFVATTGANEYLFSVKPKPWALYFINQGNLLATLLVMGAVIASWV
jgi:hypothetical protein